MSIIQQLTAAKYLNFQNSFNDCATLQPLSSSQIVNHDATADCHIADNTHELYDMSITFTATPCLPQSLIMSVCFICILYVTVYCSFYCIISRAGND